MNLDLSSRARASGPAQAAPSPEHALVCRDLWVAYRREEVLRGVNLAVPRGAFLPLLGPNGAGKTTLLKAMLGLVRPLRGAVVSDFKQRPPGYVPQQASIDPCFPIDAAGIVAMGLYPGRGWWRPLGRAGRRAVAEALEMVGLGVHARKLFSELSGGMRQKALIARALVGGAAVLVLDEPTAGLDEAAQREILARLAGLNREQGRTVILAHHGEALLGGLAGQVAQVERGRVRLRSLAGGGGGGHV
ncbi:MAG: ATP-binding cassette domain-containing protein [Pseudomonadota bacterium]